jgi:hypothetical protein
MSKYINSNSQIMGLRSVDEIENIIAKRIRPSGLLDIFNLFDGVISYQMNLSNEDYKVWKFDNVSAIANGSNQSLVGETVKKTAYNLSNVGSNEYVAGVFSNMQAITVDSDMESKEIKLGQSSINKLWVEFDSHIMGTIATVNPEIKKMNSGLLDFISTVDNSVFGTSAIVNSYANKKKIYDLATETQSTINTANGYEYNYPMYIVVAGSKMSNVFQSPYNDSASTLSTETLADLLSKRGIICVYLSNQSDTRDYALLTPAYSFKMFNGYTPFRQVVNGVKRSGDFRIYNEIFYLYSNPFLVPNVELGNLGVIINGGATGINGGAVVISANSNPEQSKESKSK